MPDKIDWKKRFPGARLHREAKTLSAMIKLYCRKQHGRKGELCRECLELEEYALLKLEKCPFGEGKTTCLKCPVHCYRPAMRERVRSVMRYSGPKMAYTHPVMTVAHFLDGRRNEPVKEKG